MRVEGTSSAEPAEQITRDQSTSEDISPESPETTDVPDAEDLTETREREAPFELDIESTGPRKRLREDRLDRDINDRLESYLEGELDRLNDFVRAFDKRFDFQIHEEADDYFIQVWDIVDDELIREVPPERIMDVMARVDDMIGIIFDEQV